MMCLFKPNTYDPKDWQCPKPSCRTVNFKKRQTCISCGARKPEGTNRPLDDWRDGEKLFKKGSTLEDWSDLMQGGLLPNHMIWVNASSHDDVWSYAKSVLSKGCLMEHEYYDWNSRPQGRVEDWGDLGHGHLIGGHLVASDGYYEWHGKQEQQRKKEEEKENVAEGEAEATRGLSLEDDAWAYAESVLNKGFILEYDAMIGVESPKESHV
ncbi:unnamed protein product [Durusdinium trenchii]|uniref:RanBP2-type domain-containing protein n=1 Tax=Durusdinium trenchii TaxID=1381693 RepID=A0ABP0KXZ3_9DINO